MKAVVLVGLILAIGTALGGLVTAAPDFPDDDCAMCHEEAMDERPAVTSAQISASVHDGLGCVDCHSSIADLPHAETLTAVACSDCHDDIQDEFAAGVHGKARSRGVRNAPSCRGCHGVHDIASPSEQKIYCGRCHDEAQADFDASIHGQALNRDAPFAPECIDCHGAHGIKSSDDPEAMTFKMNVPMMCGGCHREGAPVARSYDIAEHNILENYSQSIHGEGLFRKGLTVTATCTSCHGNHRILPHTDPRSSISPRNLAETCMACHSRIEQVHVQVIRGELWESEPGAIPSCTDCHLPHKVRKEIITDTLSDRDCLRCHGEPEQLHADGDSLLTGAQPDSLFNTAYGDSLPMMVDSEELELSVHDNIPCVKCHTDVDPQSTTRPCEKSGRAECSNCHAKMSEEYKASGHGQAFEQGIKEAPYCTDCHGVHGVKSHAEDGSPTYRAAVPALCGGCHVHGGTAPETGELSETDALTDYSKSVHGRGLSEKGLLPSAICIDCHGAHLVLKHTDDRSTVFPKNVPATCATCHRGIYKDFIKSTHYDPDGDSKDKLPTCTDCHSAHTIGEVEKDQFMNEVTGQCGSCHEETAETYLETMHGKAYHLGYLQAAKCSDCHGSHLILGTNDPESSVGLSNIVGTCQKCHEDANARFTGYLTHATHHDPVKYPILYWTYRAMTTLLVSVFLFFGIHTLLWLPRSFAEYRKRREHRLSTEPKYFIRRFTRAQRITHIFVILSFLSLALTGMMLKFSGMAWAAALSEFLGGVRVAGNIHRVAAVVTLGYFIAHLTWLAVFKHRRHLTLRKLIFGKNSMMFNRKDLQDFIGTVKWFVGAGPRPRYGRFTYWEKFDYLAVFWGVAVIGISGLMLWFPALFTRIVPGWGINIATIIHSDEALLAVGFIFTIHFFNTHLRPEAFPMDTVIFTGVSPLEEYRKDRPVEYEEMKRSGELGKRVVRARISKPREIAIRTMGYTFLGIGIVLIILIVYSVLFGYKL